MTTEELPRYLRARQVSELTTIPEGTLANWRAALKGPRWLKFGAIVVYPREDLVKWMEGDL